MNSPEVEAPKGLLEKIMRRIHKEQRLLILKRTALFSFALAGSFFLLGISFGNLLRDATDTGFLNISSLAFSDFSILAEYWENLAVALLESLPAISLGIFLAGLALFAITLRSLIKNVKTFKILKNA